MVVSRTSMSFPNLLRILPWGVVSKKDIGDRRDGGESGVVKLLGSTDGAQVQEYRSKDHSYGLLGIKDKQLD